jgi:hypothetical protein
MTLIKIEVPQAADAQLLFVPSDSGLDSGLPTPCSFYL